MKFIAFMILIIMCFFSAMQVTIAKHKTRQVFVEIQTLEKERDKLNEEWGRLQLEFSTWAIGEHIESEASTKLNMKVPEISNIRLLSR